MQFRYSKIKSTGVIYESQSGEAKTGLDSLRQNAEQHYPGDVEVGYCTGAELDILLAARETAWDAADPMRVWLRDMSDFEMSRTREDHIKDVKSGVADSEAEQAIYDAKVARRAEKP
tara:strand:- start:2 stop:352 length:351 start_codon:yes stop_codon:yes gene_type:complete